MKRIYFTVTDRQHEVLQLMADAKGIRTVGQMVREQAFSAANRVPMRGIMARLSGITDLQESAGNGVVVKFTNEADHSTGSAAASNVGGNDSQFDKVN